MFSELDYVLRNAFWMLKMRLCCLEMDLQYIKCMLTKKKTFWARDRGVRSARVVPLEVAVEVPRLTVGHGQQGLPEPPLFFGKSREFRENTVCALKIWICGGAR